MTIHPSAIIEDGVELGPGVSVGPFAVIRNGVKIGEETSIEAHALIEGKTLIGANNKIGAGAVIGSPPQDLKYQGEETEVVIGDNNTIREYVTINRGTAQRKKTELGSGCLLMAYSHIAHDCIVGNDVILANCATLAGHVTIEDQAIIGGLTPIHQFVKIGRLAYIGGSSRVAQDIPPFSLSAGIPLKVYGLNVVGLRRKNYSKEDRAHLKRAFKFIFSSSMNTAQALNSIKSEDIIENDSVRYLVDFITNSERGISKS